MIRVVRLTGFLLIVAGVLVFLSYFVEPLREVWPWLLELPLPIRVGLALAGIGLVVLMASLLWERWGERGLDRSLRDDD